MVTEPSFATPLRQARQDLKQTPAEAQKGSGISINVLRDLEAGTCNVVEPVYARLALRTYATYLGLEVEPLEKLFNAQFNAQLESPSYQQESPTITITKLGLPNFNFSPRLIFFIIIFGVALFILLRLLMGSNAAQTATYLDQNIPPLSTLNTPPPSAINHP